MLLAAQFVLCDMRTFWPEETGRLAVPPWPLVEAGAEFVRGFGPIRRRRRGGTQVWDGDELYCDASNAVRFRGHLRPGPRLEQGARVAIRAAFRRLQCDGVAMARIDVGLSVHRRQRDALPSSALDALLGWFLALAVDIPAPGIGYGGPLINAGPALARHFSSSTTARGAPPPKPHWIQPTLPLVFIQIEPGEVAASLARTGRECLRVEEVEVEHRRVQSHGGQARVWVARCLAPARRDVARRLRLHLTSLHATAQSLRIVLRAVRTGKLPVRPDTEGTQALQRYLLDAARTLTARSSHGLRADQVLELAQTCEDLVEPDHRHTVVQALSGIRRQVRDRVQDAIENCHPRADVVYLIKGQNVTMNEFKIEFGDHNVLHGDFVVAQKIQDSFNRVQGSDSNEELKRTLAALSAEVARMTKALSEKEARQAARDLDTLCEEAVSPEPRKRWYELAADSLVETATRLGAAAGKVVQLVRSVVTMLGG